MADQGPIAVRVLGRGAPPSNPIQVVGDRLRQALTLRPALVPADTDCWRAVAGEGDGLPGVVLDRYAGLYVLRLYSAAWLPHHEALVDVLRQIPGLTWLWQRLGVGTVDGGQEGGVALVGGEPPETLVVKEAGLSFLVRPRTGQKTGLFLDQREHRLLVRRLAAGRNAANLFGYTGGFSVAAAAGGAPRVVTVDIAADALQDARENFRLNGLDPNRHGFEAVDAFRWESAAPLDLLVLDPPALTRKARDDEGARLAYRKLHLHHQGNVSVGGFLATSSCSARVPLTEWQEAIRLGLGAGDWSWHWCSQEPFDHPTSLSHSEGHYLKFAVLRRRSERGIQPPA